MVAGQWASDHLGRAARIVIEDAPLHGGVLSMFDDWIKLASQTAERFRHAHPDLDGRGVFPAR